jgi:hypothetical protein
MAAVDELRRQIKAVDHAVKTGGGMNQATIDAFDGIVDALKTIADALDNSTIKVNDITVKRK